jgi:quinol monooxygenase YgiN
MPAVMLDVTVEIAADRVPAFLAAIEEDAVGSRGEPGCRRFDVWKV